jgi:predicted metal-dependent enzyme (double-stranded beta helix superfamily)
MATSGRPGQPGQGGEARTVTSRRAGGGDAMMSSMFVIDDFIADCQQALTETEPRRAIRETLTRAVADASSVASALEHHHSGITLLHNTDDLTVLNVVWGPGMRLQPHDHRMWAAIGIYAGQENNGFFRRDGDVIVDSGGKQLVESDVLLLGDDAIHCVTNPLRSYTGAIHVYGGNFVTQARSQWDPETKREEPYDYERILKQFEASNASNVDGA